MAAVWDPNKPGTIGLPWFVDTVQDIGPSAGRGLALTIDSTATETIASAYVGVGSVSNAGYLLAEVYPIASVVPGAVTTSSFAPNGVLTGDGSTWRAQPANSTTAAALAAAVDNGVVNTSIYDEYEGTLSQHTRLEFLYPTAGALWPANQRVVSGALVFSAALTDSTGQLQIWYNQAGTRVLMGTVTLTTDIQTYSVPLGEINPVTNLPWTRAEVQDFDGASGFGFRPLTGTAKPLRIYDVRLDLSWVTEDRVAVGTLAVSPTDTLAWGTVPLQTPNGGAANWAKANTTSYTVVVRPPTGPLSSPASFSVRTLGQTGVTELPQGSIPYRPVLGTGGLVVAEGDPVVQAVALAFDINASATDSADGQPYTRYNNQQSGTTGQLVNGATAGAYSLLRALVSVQVGTDTDFTWSVETTGGVTLDSGVLPYVDVVADGPVGRVVAYDPDELVDLYVVEIEVSVTLAPATTYELHGDPAGIGATSTRLAALDTITPGGGATPSVASYGGTTLDYGGTSVLDAPVTLSTQPTTPTGFQASIYDRAVTPTGQPGSCGLSTLEEIRLQWNATSVGAAFAYYEVERSTDQGDTWHLVYRITDETVDQATDQEHPYNLETWYRLRTVRAGDLIPSVWSDTEQITATVPGCPLVFSSNLHPTLMLGFPRTDRITWQQPSSDEVSIVAPTGADYHTALIAEENRGDIINQTVTVWSPGFSAPSDPPAPGRWMLDPVIALTRAPAPYTCVRDETGRVWYANVNITEGTRAEPNHSYTADAVITELTDTPAVIDLAQTVSGSADIWFDARAYGGTGRLLNLGLFGPAQDGVPSTATGPGTDIELAELDGHTVIHIGAGAINAEFTTPDYAGTDIGAGDSATQAGFAAMGADPPYTGIAGFGFGMINTVIVSGWGGIEVSTFSPQPALYLAYNDGDFDPFPPGITNPGGGVLVHLVCVLNRADDTFTLYVNGDFYASTTAVGLGAVNSALGGHAAGLASSGGQYFGCSQFWNGTALTAGEAAALYAEAVQDHLPAPVPSLYTA